MQNNKLLTKIFYSIKFINYNKIRKKLQNYFKKEMTMFILFIILALNLFTVHSQSIQETQQKQSCGKECTFIVTNSSKITFTVNKEIELTNELKQVKEDITEIVINGELTTYFDGFYNFFTNVNSVEFHIQKIPDTLFYNSPIKTVLIGEEVEEIQHNAFDNCKFLQTIQFSNTSKLKSIEEYAFKKCVDRKAHV